MDTPDSLQLTEKIIQTPDLKNDIKVVSQLKDGEADEEIYNPDFTEWIGKVVRVQQNPWTEKDILEDDQFLLYDLRLRKSI